MNELTLTVVAQIINFGILWYLLHALVLKKVFELIKLQKNDLLALEDSVVAARESVKKAEEQKKEEWNHITASFAQKIPYKGCDLARHDITPLCHISPGLQTEEKEALVKETVDYITRKIVHDQ